MSSIPEEFKKILIEIFNKDRKEFIETNKISDLYERDFNRHRNKIIGRISLIQELLNLPDLITGNKIRSLVSDKMKEDNLKIRDFLLEKIGLMDRELEDLINQKFKLTDDFVRMEVIKAQKYAYEETLFFILKKEAI